MSILGPHITIVESGTATGNLDRRYSSPEALQVNRTRFFAAAGIAKSRVVYMDALGGDTFVDLDQISDARQVIPADAFITTQPGLGLALFPADCIPLVILDSKNQVLALVHLGWRGCVAKLHRSVIAYMQRQHATDPADLHCYLGPSIKQAHYVMPQLHPAQKTAEWSSAITKNSDGHFSIDLPGYVVSDLQRLGVASENIAVSPEDTADESKKYFSNFRYRQPGSTESEGRNGFLVWLNS